MTERSYDGPNRRGWHLDRSIPIPFLLVLIGQLALGAWWLSALDKRVQRVEEITTTQTQDLRDLRAVNNRLDSIERELTAIKELLWRISRTRNAPGGP